MPRYIDRDTAIRTAIEMCVKVVGNGITQIEAVEIANAFEDIPTADVVPKSEVKRLLDEIDSWFMYCEDYSGHLIKIKLAEFKKKYTEDRK